MRLSIEHISVERGGRLVLSDLSFSVSAGEVLVLSGRNGVGKTSLLRTVAGFLRPRSGRITLDGGDLEHELGEQCHWVGHLNAVKGSLTVAENLTFWSRLLARTEPSPLAPALNAFDLTTLADIPARTLSQGQTRRLALARLLVAPRPIWLLDEPSVTLDSASQRLLANCIDRHTAEGGLVVAATHAPLGLARTREVQLTTHSEAA